MRNWLKIRENRIGLLFAAGHWVLLVLLVIIALTIHPQAGNNQVFFILPALLLFLDLPGILASFILWSPFLYLNDYHTFTYGMFSMVFFTVSYEWIVIGRFVCNMFTSVESKMRLLSINDD